MRFINIVVLIAACASLGHAGETCSRDNSKCAAQVTVYGTKDNFVPHQCHEALEALNDEVEGFCKRYGNGLIDVTCDFTRGEPQCGMKGQKAQKGFKGCHDTCECRVHRPCEGLNMTHYNKCHHSECKWNSRKHEWGYVSVCDKGVCAENKHWDCDKCQCVCNVDGSVINIRDGYHWNNYTCAVECDFRRNCTAGKHWDRKTCSCQCDECDHDCCPKKNIKGFYSERNDCLKTWNDETCQCQCKDNLKPCRDGFVRDTRGDCKCHCDVVSGAKKCSKFKRFNEQTCSCECPTEQVMCMENEDWNPDTCRCESCCGPHPLTLKDELAYDPCTEFVCVRGHDHHHHHHDQCHHGHKGMKGGCEDSKCHWEPKSKCLCERPDKACKCVPNEVINSTVNSSVRYNNLRVLETVAVVGTINGTVNGTNSTGNCTDTNSTGNCTGNSTNSTGNCTGNSTNSTGNSTCDDDEQVAQVTCHWDCPQCHEQEQQDQCHQQQEGSCNRRPGWGAGYVFDGSELSHYSYSESAPSSHCNEDDSCYTAYSASDHSDYSPVVSSHSSDSERFIGVLSVIKGCFGKSHAHHYFEDSARSKSYTRIFPVCVDKHHGDFSMFKEVTHPKVQKWAAARVKCEKGSRPAAVRLACSEELDRHASSKCHSRTGCSKGQIHQDPKALFPYYTFCRDNSVISWHDFTDGVSQMWNTRQW